MAFRFTATRLMRLAATLLVVCWVSGARAEEASSPASQQQPAATPSPSPSVSASPGKTRVEKKKAAPVSAISSGEISGYENYPGHVRKVLDLALSLTNQNLGYRYGSADPAAGGMDCSGFVFYVLTQNGVRDVPRDSSQQYVWLRKAGNFRAVNSRHGRIRPQSIEF